MEVRKVEAIFVAKPLGKSPVRRQGLRSEDNIKMNVNEPEKTNFEARSKVVLTRVLIVTEYEDQ